MITSGLQRCCYALDVYLSKEITLKKCFSVFRLWFFYVYIFCISLGVWHPAHSHLQQWSSVHPAVADLTTLLLDLATSSLLSFFKKQTKTKGHLKSKCMDSTALDVLTSHQRHSSLSFFRLWSELNNQSNCGVDSYQLSFNIAKQGTICYAFP